MDRNIDTLDHKAPVAAVDGRDELACCPARHVNCRSALGCKQQQPGLHDTCECMRCEYRHHWRKRWLSGVQGDRCGSALYTCSGALRLYGMLLCTETCIRPVLVGAVCIVPAFFFTR